MVFSSTIFLFLFFPCFFGIYYLTVQKYRNYVILAASAIFYAWGAPSFVGVLLLSLIIDWHFVNAIYSKRNYKGQSKVYLAAGVIINLCLLAYFKYFNFFIGNVNLLLNKFGMTNIEWTKVVLPIGVSFIVFHKLSYIIDVYRNEKKPTEKLSTYILYILLFPMSIAGPIIKFQDIADQLEHHSDTFDNILEGLYRFSKGLFKKVWIADTLAITADRMFAVPGGELTFWYAWVGIIYYALQIYFDFSGYADMAIGLSRMMGFNISENFNKPYISQTITEFWRRWHISLSRWMRSYLYIPLGGNRRSKRRNYLNLWIVFLVSGLWHGANWTFVAWGAFHGFLMVCDKLFWLKISEKVPKAVNIGLTFIMVLIAWVFFRSDSIGHALSYIKTMFDFPTARNFIPVQFYFTNQIVLTFIVALVITFAPASRYYSTFVEKTKPFFNSQGIKAVIVIVILLVSVARCVTSTFSPFIYFRF